MIAVDNSELASVSRLPDIPGAQSSGILLTKLPSFAIIRLPTDNKQGALFFSPPSDCNLNGCRQSASFRMGPITSCCPLALAANIRRRRFVMEEWRNVPGFEGYQISDRGRMRSRKAHWPNRPDRLCQRWHTLKLRQDQKGYPSVILYSGSKRYPRRVHRLVLEAFVGSRPDGYVACHNNGDKTDNRPANLRWDTPQSNVEDGKRHGAWSKPRRPWQLLQGRKLNADQVKEIRKLHRRGIKQTDIAQRFSISSRHVNDVIHRRVWKHVK